MPAESRWKAQVSYHSGDVGRFIALRHHHPPLQNMLDKSPHATTLLYRLEDPVVVVPDVPARPPLPHGMPGHEDEVVEVCEVDC